MGPPERQEWADVGIEGVHEDGVRGQHVVRPLGGLECVEIKHRRTRHHLLHIEDRPDLRGDLLFDVVTLIEHQREVRVGREAVGTKHLDEDSVELERVGCAYDEIIVGVKTRVEVEGTEFPSRSSCATMNSTLVPGA